MKNSEKLFCSLIKNLYICKKKEMKKTILSFKGEKFLRESELIGDVEKIIWFHQTKLGDKEILIEDELNELEDSYMTSIINQITPELPII